MNNGDAIVYDNEMGAPDDQPASTSLLRGNVMIHEWKWNSKKKAIDIQLEPLEDTSPVDEEFQVYPNPFQASLYLDLLTQQEGEITIELVDVSGKVVDVLFDGSVQAQIKQHFLLNTSDLMPGSYLLLFHHWTVSLLGCKFRHHGTPFNDFN